MKRLLIVGVFSVAALASGIKTAGNPQTIESPADPAAGANYAVTVPSGERWKIYALRFRITASGAAANRALEIRFVDDSANVVYQTACNVTITAGQVYEHNLGAGLGAVGDFSTLTNTAACPFPEGFVLLEGWQVTTNTANIQAGDQLSDMRILVQKF